MGWKDCRPGVVESGIYGGRRRWVRKTGKSHWTHGTASGPREHHGCFRPGAVRSKQVALHGSVSYVAFRAGVRESKEGSSRLRHQLEQGFHQAGAKNLRAPRTRPFLSAAAILM